MTTTSDRTLVSRSTPPSVAVQQLAAAVAAVAEQSPAELPGSQALADAAVLLELQDSLRVLTMDRLGDVEQRGLHTLDGAATTAAWLRAQQTSADTTDLPLARKLADLPLLRAELHDGDLSVKTVRRLAASLTALRRHVDRPDRLIDGLPAEPVLTGVIVDGALGVVCTALGGLDDHDLRLAQLRERLADIASRPTSELLRLEAAWLEVARHVEPDQLPRALELLTDALLPVQLDARAADAEVNRGVTLTRNPDGAGWHVSQGELDLECGELLNAVIQAEMAVDQDNPADTAAYAQLRQAGWQPGDDLPTTGTRPRSSRQQRHDALKRGLRRLLDSGALGLRDKVAPHLGATVSIEALHGEPGALPPISTVTGAPLPLRLVQRWWSDSSITRFVMSLGRRVIETSHTERTLKAHERRAKQIETGGRCQAAGCRSSGGIPHHVHLYSRDGTTSYTDTVMICPADHHHLHDDKTLRLKDGRWINENGWTCGPGP